MTSEQSLSIKTSTITIKVIQVDGHKMTKATWDQFQFGCDETVYRDIENNGNKYTVLGWVNVDKRSYLLYFVNQSGEIYKATTMWRRIREFGLEQLYIAT